LDIDEANRRIAALLTVRSPYLYARYLWEGLSMRLRPV
jgi:hypothetical protein